ncbi:MAG: hypothetical protein AAF447_10070 [Myxococcota bacterium]
MPRIESERRVRTGGAHALLIRYTDGVKAEVSRGVLGALVPPYFAHRVAMLTALLSVVSCASSSGAPAGDLESIDDPLSLAQTPEDRDFICQQLMVEGLLDPWAECVARTGVGVGPVGYENFISTCETLVSERLDLIDPGCSFRDAFDCYFIELEYACDGEPDEARSVAGDACLDSPHTACSLLRR